MKYANLHLHSIYSDGVFTPRELCEKAKALGYGAIALTDHDTAEGYSELKKAADELGLEHIIGAELACEAFGESFHIVALDFDPTDKGLSEHMALLRENAYNKTKAKFEMLSDTEPFCHVSWDDIVSDAPVGSTFCNEQIFSALSKRGKFRQESFWDSFYRYKAMRAEYKKHDVDTSAKHVIALIRNAGGIAVLAHPNGQTGYLEALMALGLSGVECDHPDLTEPQKSAASAFALSNSLYVSGGTDHVGRLGDHTDKRGEKPYAIELAVDKFYSPLTFDARNGISRDEFYRIKMRIYG
jgi:predicted metal-dependent phosphoesterase TrpH